MHPPTSNRRAVRRLRAFCVTVALLAVTSVAGCSGAHANTPAVPASAAGPATAVSSDPRVEQALENSCFDCHSDQAPVSWNAKLAPSYLFGTVDARKSLNFSDWHRYDATRRNAEKAAIAKVIKDGSMAPWDYNFLHPSARLTGEQRQELLQWAARKPAQTKR